MPQQKRSKMLQLGVLNSATSYILQVLVMPSKTRSCRHSNSSKTQIQHLRILLSPESLLYSPFHFRDRQKGSLFDHLRCM